MANNQFTPEQMEQLLNYASQRLGRTPEELKTAFQENGLAGLSSVMSADEAAKAQELIRNKEKAARLLNDPQIQQLLRQLLG